MVFFVAGPRFLTSLTIHVSTRRNFVGNVSDGC